MRPGESEEQRVRRVDRYVASQLAKGYLDGQAEYMTQRKIDHDGPLVAKQKRNYYRRLAAKYMVKTWLLRNQ